MKKFKKHKTDFIICLIFGVVVVLAYSAVSSDVLIDWIIGVATK